MPADPRYPGVYIEEQPGGVPRIEGVSTSTAAFVGWAAKGPTDRAERLNGAAEFDERFGGLDARSWLGYAVHHFFMNGGRSCHVVRLAASNAAAAHAMIGGLSVAAANAGEWANELTIRVESHAPHDDDRLRLSVIRRAGEADESIVETYDGLSMKHDDARHVSSVINHRSRVIRMESSGLAMPPDGLTPMAGGADGDVLHPNDHGRFDQQVTPGNGTGIDHLDRVEDVNLLCVPGLSNPAAWAAIQAYAVARRAMLIADAPMDATRATLRFGLGPQLTGEAAANAAVYFPWVLAADPLNGGQPRSFPPGGFVAGLYARTDAARGVWKSPAGADASLIGADDVAVPLTDRDNGVLNPRAINCLRKMPGRGVVAWGARTMRGDDQYGSPWKYVAVRRLALFIEQSVARGTKWVVFEPNQAATWARVRVQVEWFMNELFRLGALPGGTPRDAYFVRCGLGDTMSRRDVEQGVVIILIGFAPVKPAEFVPVEIRQAAGLTP